MSHESAGYLEHRGRMYRFDRASCRWSWSALDIEADGKGVSFRFVAIPFPDVKQLSELPGHTWNPDTDDLGFHADVFAEGWFKLRNRDQRVNAASFRCVSYSLESARLVIEFEVSLEDEETGREEKVEGAARCKVLA